MIVEKCDSKILLELLTRVDALFSVPLSDKQDLEDLSKKFSLFGTVCAVIKNGKILSLVAGYTNNVINNMAYISVVVTLPEEQGKGYAKQLLNEFIEIARKKGLTAVHLYSSPVALRMYIKMGFEKYFPPNETRPNDLHLVFWL